MLDDDAARRALRTLNDEAGPPVTTTLDQVLHRGRRRLLGQRIGAVAGVVAVVATIGVGAMLLRPGDQGADGVRVADDPAAQTAPTSTNPDPAPRTTVTTSSTPENRIAPLPGWDPATPRVGRDCGIAQVPPAEPDIALVPQDEVRARLVESIEEVTGEPPTGVTSQWPDNSGKLDASPRGHVTAEVSTDHGDGHILLEAGRFGGTPEKMADVDIFGYGQCVVPLRRVLENGTVLQLYPADDRDPAEPRQHVRIYQPDGRFYVLTSAGHHRIIVADGDKAGQRIEQGPAPLPTTAPQLADMAERFAGWW